MQIVPARISLFFSSVSLLYLIFISRLMQIAQEYL